MYAITHLGRLNEVLVKQRLVCILPRNHSEVVNVKHFKCLPGSQIRCTFPILQRCYCQKTNDKLKKSSHFDVKKNNPVGNYAFEKFNNYMKGYEKTLETKFPRAFLVYQIFAVGIKELYRDVKLYGSLMVSLSQGKRLSEFKRYEIEKYYTMPKEFKRVAPVLLISALPFANYLIFPLAYMFPKTLLSSHFWSIQQKVDFALQDHKQKLLNYRPVFRHLQAKVDRISDTKTQENCANLLHKIGSGTHPSISEILAVKDLFLSGPYAINQLVYNHVSCLSRMHNLSVFGLRKRRLIYHAGIIRQMDLAIIRENLNMMNLEELRSSCFLRGVNPIGMSKEDMSTWLNNWLEVTKHINNNNLSLLLHCPIFLSYNYPTNWSLIH